MTWTKHGWGSLGATELACIILVWILIAFGAIAFCLMNKVCLTVFAILTFFSFCFTFAIAIFCFLGTKTRNWDENMGCNAKYDGLFRVWASVDTYLQTVDSLFCSSRCKCYFNSTTSSLFTTSSISMPFVSQWSVRDTRHDTFTRFQDCPDDVVTDAYNKYIDRNAYYNHTFRPDWFHTYYRHIEEYFNCNGFCGTTYYDMIRKTNQKMVKYLFSDITRGIPEHIGCLPRLLDWVTKTLNAFAAVGCFLALLQFILLIIAIWLTCLIGKTKDDQNDYVGNTKKKSMAKESNNQSIISLGDLVEKSKRKSKEIETPFEIDNDKQKERERQLLQNKDKEKVKQKKEDDKIQIIGQTPGEYAYELGNMDSSFIPSDGQRNEVDFKFNPSIKQ